ncbi:hypothetical protein [Streptomyces sp. NPDC048419]|uniref:hypothetical protein n=1 Tax=Streptomyces sp. NPDC048419 TaxID=3365547 RepID=UPI00371005E8
MHLDEVAHVHDLQADPRDAGHLAGHHAGHDADGPGRVRRQDGAEDGGSTVVSSVGPAWLSMKSQAVRSARALERR